MVAELNLFNNDNNDKNDDNNDDNNDNNDDNNDNNDDKNDNNDNSTTTTTTTITTNQQQQQHNATAKKSTIRKPPRMKFQNTHVTHVIGAQVNVRCTQEPPFTKERVTEGHCPGVAALMVD